MILRRPRHAQDNTHRAADVVPVQVHRLLDRLVSGGSLAGVVGFEPTVRGTKNRCLTTWLHPNRDALVTLRGSQDQDPCVKNLWFIFAVSNRLIIGPDIGFRSNDRV